MRCADFFRQLLLATTVTALLSACASAPAPEPDAALPAEDLVQADPFAKRTPGPNPYDASPEPTEPQLRALFDKALAQMRAQKWSKAEPLLQQAIVLGPTYSGPYYNLGRVYEGLNRPADAALQYQQAIAVNGNNIYAMNALARLKREAAQFAEAEALYKSALAVWPDHAASHRNLGILYELYMGRLPEALEHYKHYQALQAEDDRMMTGWIVDLERRLPAPAAPPSDAVQPEVRQPEAQEVSVNDPRNE